MSQLMAHSNTENMYYEKILPSKCRNFTSCLILSTTCMCVSNTYLMTKLNSYPLGKCYIMAVARKHQYLRNEYLRSLSEERIKQTIVLNEALSYFVLQYEHQLFAGIIEYFYHLHCNCQSSFYCLHNVRCSTKHGQHSKDAHAN